MDEDKQRISDAIKAEKDCSVNLLNYKKDGTKFINEVSSFLVCRCMKEDSYGGVISEFRMYLCYSYSFPYL